MPEKTSMDTMHQGLNMSRNPREARDRSQQGPPPPQKQNWPGHEKDLNPPADHGEMTYKGGGKLEGLKTLITGGDSGIGRAVAIAFAREGADVAIAYYDEDDDAQETLRWVNDAGQKGIGIAGDVQKHEDCARIVDQTVRDLGGLNVLVNNAAYQKEAANFVDIPPEQVEQTVRTNLIGYIWMAQNALRYMKAGDTIINTGSITGLAGLPVLVDYSATKGGIHIFTKALAQELSGQGIRVNCVAPGSVWTPLIPSTLSTDYVEQFGDSSLWKRPTQPAELAPFYVFLASADSRYCTGEIMAPTGTQETSR